MKHDVEARVYAYAHARRTKRQNLLVRGSHPQLVCAFLIDEGVKAISASVIFPWSLPGGCQFGGHGKPGGGGGKPGSRGLKRILTC